MQEGKEVIGPRYVVVTRFKAFNQESERAFASHLKNVNQQTREKPQGLLAPPLLRKTAEGYYTITQWSSQEEKDVFENSGHHLSAKQESDKLGKTDHFGWYSETSPTFKEANQKLEENLNTNNIIPTT